LLYRIPVFLSLLACQLQYKITDEWSRAISDRLNAEFGPGGRVEGIYAYMNALAAQAFAHTQALGSFRSGREPVRLGNAPPTQTIGSGGIPKTMEKTSPIKPYSSPSGGGIQIQVDLSQDLEARVIDQTKTEIADVFVRQVK